MRIDRDVQGTGCCLHKHTLIVMVMQNMHHDVVSQAHAPLFLEAMLFHCCLCRIIFDRPFLLLLYVDMGMPIRHMAVTCLTYRKQVPVRPAHGLPLL